MLTLTLNPNPNQVGYDARGQRYTTRARELLDVQGDASGRTEMTKDDVLLVTGGERKDLRRVGVEESEYRSSGWVSSW